MYDDYINYYGFPRELGFIRTKQLTDIGEAGALIELIIPRVSPDGAAAQFRVNAVPGQSMLSMYKQRYVLPARLQHSAAPQAASTKQSRATPLQCPFAFPTHTPFPFPSQPLPVSPPGVRESTCSSYAAGCLSWTTARSSSCDTVMRGAG